MQGISTRTTLIQCPVSKTNKFRKRLTRCSLLSATKLQNEALVSWADASIDDFRRVDLITKQDQLTLVAKESIRERSVVFSVPESSWITMDIVRGSEIGPLISGLEPWLQFSLFLIFEKQNTSSSWKPYFSALSDTLPSPAFWSEDRLQTIEGSQLHEASIGYRLFFEQQYNQLIETVFQKDRQLFKEELFTFDKFCWAVGSVRSQLHPPLEKDKISLLPIVSNIGHSREGNVELKLASRSLMKSTPSLDVITIKEVKIGESLVMDYGPEKLDNQIALDYGVYDDLHPQGGYKLTMSIPQEDKFLDDKLDVLELCGLEESPSFDLLVNEEPAENLLIFLRLLNLSGKDAFHLEAIFRGEIKDHLLDPISKENENSVCETMISGCQDALQRYQNIPKTSSNSHETAMYQVGENTVGVVVWE
eukprot:g742.t1